MRRFWLPLVLALTGLVVLLYLGTWQVQRLEWKRGILDEITATIGANPAPLPARPDPDSHKYQPVALTGTIEPGTLRVLVSRKHVGAGYLIVSPLVTEDGRRILLDRGFVPVAAADRALPTGPVEVLGNIHWPDDRTSATPKNDVAGNIWFARDIPQMAQALGTEPLLVVARAVSPADPGLTPMPVDTANIPNDHLQYAITWFSLAALWALMSGAYLWRARQSAKGPNP